MTAQVQDDRGTPRQAKRLAMLAGVGALMLLPVIAIRIAENAQRDPGDYVFLAILFTGIAVASEIAARVSRQRAYAAAAGIAIAAALLQAWINLAVGTIGSEDNPANWIYAAVIGIAVLGALLARFRPSGMACAMTAAAAAQVLAFAMALAAGLGFTGPITIFFTALWLISAGLFRRAGRGD
jgi:peptidoglycan/LPS O-acetylase OafA/YrhL